MTKDEPTEEELESRRAWRRVRRFVVYPLLALAVLIACPVVWLVSINRSAQKQVDAQLETLRNQGLPYDNASLSTYYERLTTTKDLSQWLEVLTTVDSPEFAAAEKLLPEPGVAGPAPGEAWPEKEQVQAFLKRWEELLGVAQQLAQADVKRRMPLHVDGIHTQLDWATKVGRLSNIFQLQANDAIYRRDSAATADAILSILGCARSIEGQPLVLAQVFVIVHETVAIGQLKRAVELNILTAEDLKRVRERLESRTPWSTRWQVGIAGERAMLLPTFTDPERYLSEDSRPIALRIPFRANDQLNFLRMTNRSVEIPTDNLTVFRNANLALSAELDKSLRKVNWSSPMDNTITSLVLPAYGAYGDSILLAEKQRRLGLLGIGVREYQYKFGKLPDTLDDLKQVGIDAAQLSPPGNKPFGFRKLDSSVALWGSIARGASDSTPDDPPDLDNPSHPWERQWLWQMEK